MTPLRNLETRCEPERAGTAQFSQLNSAFATAKAPQCEPNLLQMSRAFDEEIYLAALREAIYNLDLVRVTR